MATPVALVLSAILFFAASAYGQSEGLIPVPSALTPQLGAYYINKLGPALRYYGLLTQRNNAGTNAYVLANGLPDILDPLSAARTISPLRAVYSKNGMGGKVKVEIFYKLLRCVNDNCGIVERVVVAGVRPGASGPADVLSILKGGVGNSFWMINANQASANALLASAEERSYKDDTYGTQLYYKVTVQPKACSAVLPQTAWASIGEFTNIPQFACLREPGFNVLFATNTPKGLQQMMQDIVPPEQCDGSLGVILSTSGPTISKVVREPGGVPRMVVVNLPGISGAGPCFSLYNTNTRVLALTQYISLTPFYEETYDSDLANVTAFGAELGFNGSCAFEAVQHTYGPLLTGQSNSLRDSTNNQTFLNLLLPYNQSNTCVSIISSSLGTNNRDAGEDACAQLFFGDQSQYREAVIAQNFLPATTPVTLTSSLLPKTTADCYTGYVLSVQNIFPQVAIDFQATKNYLIGSTEVKSHLDNVASDAASILAVEVALASAGIVIARAIGGLGVYRRRQLSTPFARAIGLLLTALGITLFNVPNFALISRSLKNHRRKVSYTTAGLQNYAPGNFSAVVFAESYAFVTVQGSAATAVIGLVLYFLTLVGSLYLTWSEFTEMIHRRREATERLGPDALMQGPKLLVEWRDTDNLLHDRLYPKAVIETGQAAELELMRRQLEGRAASKKGLGDLYPPEEETEALAGDQTV